MAENTDYAAWMTDALKQQARKMTEVELGEEPIVRLVGASAEEYEEQTAESEAWNSVYAAHHEGLVQAAYQVAGSDAELMAIANIDPATEIACAGLDLLRALDDPDTYSVGIARHALRIAINTWHLPTDPDEPSNEIGTAQAAEILGVSPGRVRQLVADGRIPAIRVGGVLLLNREFVECMPRRGSGRPPASERRG
jgi:excisionase family DNA binding protein